MSTSFFISLFALPLYHFKIDIFLRFYDFYWLLCTFCDEKVSHVRNCLGVTILILRWIVDWSHRNLPSSSLWFWSQHPSFTYRYQMFLFLPAFSSPVSISISSSDLLRIFLFGSVISVVFCCLYTSMAPLICQHIFR